MTRSIAAALIAVSGACMPPSWGAGALLHPQRRALTTVPSLTHRELVIDGDGVILKGWLFSSSGSPRGTTVVYLHGTGDNRASVAWIAERLVPEGYDVLAYDSRAHGESSGDACTYGYYEKRDLSRALDQVGVTRAIVVGASLGGAVALQAAADDPRIVGVVATAVFSDLATIARERAPWFASRGQIREGLEIAGRLGRFDVAAVSPLAAAARIRVPVLLVHGALDAETRPDHSRRVFAALVGPKQLRIVDGAAHDDALGRVWGEVEAWVAAVGGN